MNWTHEKPTQEGTYWMRAAPGEDAELVHLTDSTGDGELFLVRPCRDYSEPFPGPAALWAGPLQPPGADPWSTTRPDAAGLWWAWTARDGAELVIVSDLSTEAGKPRLFGVYVSEMQRGNHEDWPLGNENTHVGYWRGTWWLRVAVPARPPGAVR